jgi:hypothetical protein
LQNQALKSGKESTFCSGLLLANSSFPSLRARYTLELIQIMMSNSSSLLRVAAQCSFICDLSMHMCVRVCVLRMHWYALKIRDFFHKLSHGGGGRGMGKPGSVKIVNSDYECEQRTSIASPLPNLLSKKKDWVKKRTQTQQQGAPLWLPVCCVTWAIHSAALAAQTPIFACDFKNT